MAISLPPDFKEFLKLCIEHSVEYLLVGGYAVAEYGYPRTTADMDVWIGPGPENAQRCLNVLNAFGFQDCGLTVDDFANPRAIFRLGVPPLRLELLMSVSGLEFAAAFSRRQTVSWDGQEVHLISLADLRANKLAAGRHKDLDDLEHLPTAEPV